MTEQQTLFRDQNIMRLRRIGIEAERIRAFYGFAKSSKSCRRVYEIADWQWRGCPSTYPDDVPITEREAVVWLGSNDITVAALKKKGVLGIYSSTGPMGETLTYDLFQIYFKLSWVEQAARMWATIPNTCNRLGVSSRYIHRHLEDIKHISAKEGMNLKWLGHNARHLVQVQSVSDFYTSKVSEPEPEPKEHETVQEELPLEAKVGSSNHIMAYVIEVATLVTRKGYSLIGNAHLQTILLRNEGLADLIDGNIPPEEVAAFINSIDHDPPHGVAPGEHARAILSNLNIRKLIALDAKLQDEDKFYREWLVDTYSATYTRKRTVTNKED